MNEIPTTRWSLVMRTSDDDPEVARRAVAGLCETYWYPVYLFFRRQRCAPDKAHELAQELFVDLIEGNDFARADKTRGRFRDYLLGAARHRLANANRADRRVARLETSFAVDTKNGEMRFVAEPATELTAEDAFRAAWAREVVARVLEGLANEYAARGDLPFFRRLVAHLVADRTEPGYADLAAAFDKNVGAVKMAVMRLRERFGTKLRDYVAAYTEDDEVEDELRFLLASLNEGAR